MWVVRTECPEVCLILEFGALFRARWGYIASKCASIMRFGALFEALGDPLISAYACSAPGAILPHMKARRRTAVPCVYAIMHLMNTINKDNENRFSIAMLLMTIIMISKHFSFVVRGLNASVFAINYRRGIALRGFGGWILDCICYIGGDDLYNYKTVFMISTIGYILYLMALWFVAERFIRAYDNSSQAMALVVFLSPMFIEMFISAENFGRSDMYLLCLSLIAAYAVISDKGLFLSVLLPIIGILIHEGYVFNYYGIVIACLIYKAVYNGSKKKSYYICYLVISVVLSAAAFSWFYFISRSVLPMTDEIYSGIVRDAERLGSPNSYVHYEALSAYVLGTDTQTWESDLMATTRLETALSLILFSPMILIACQIIKNIYKESNKKALVIILCLGSLSFVPLFISKCDYGRWLFALFFYFIGLAFMLVISDNKVVKNAIRQRIEQIEQSRWEVVFYSIYFVMFMPFYAVEINDITINLANVIDRFIM